MKLIVVGQGRHGKDTFCEIAEEHFGLTFQSSSRFALEEFVFDKMKDRYDDMEVCYADRHNHREEWYNLIIDYNKKDRSKLARGIFSKYDVYCGMRDKKELKASRKLADVVIYIDATQRLGRTESVLSNNITEYDASIVIKNNGSLEDFKRHSIRVLDSLRQALDS